MRRSRATRARSGLLCDEAQRCLVDHDQTATPVLDGVNTVTGLGCRSVLGILDPGPDRRASGYPLGYIQKLGSGSLVVSPSLVLCNGYLEKSDNGRCCPIPGLWAVAPQSALTNTTTASILSDFAPQAWVTTPWAPRYCGSCRRLSSVCSCAAEVRPLFLSCRGDSSRRRVGGRRGELLRRSGARRTDVGMLANASERPSPCPDRASGPAARPILECFVRARARVAAEAGGCGAGAVTGRGR